MTKIAFIIGGILLLAGVAFAGTVTGLGSADNPALISTTAPPTTTTRGEVEQRGRENEPGEDARGREDEARRRENEPGEDLRGPCDEAEHAGDPRCAGTPAGRLDDDAAEDRRGDDNRLSGSSGPGPSDRSGHGGGENSGHGGGNSGHGGGEDD